MGAGGNYGSKDIQKFLDGEDLVATGENVAQEAAPLIREKSHGANPEEEKKDGGDGL